MIKRLFIEKRKQFNIESQELIYKIKHWLKIDVQSIRVLDVYDISNINEELIKKSIDSVFSEINIDKVFFNIDLDNKKYFAVEPLPSQFNIKAESAIQCIKLLDLNSAPIISTSKLYIFNDDLSKENLERIKSFLINKVESCEKDLSIFNNNVDNFKTETIVINDFTKMDNLTLKKEFENNSLSLDDLLLIRDYFKNIVKREPTNAELLLLETYWSDHCRHTTFNTKLNKITIEDQPLKDDINDSLNFYLGLKNKYSKNKDITLMNVATIMLKYLNDINLYNDVEKSEEINACGVFIDALIDNKKEKWLVQFKNETHNHPTEIEPFGGAATCLGGAIRDPLSGRSYIYQGIRISGSANPNEAIQDTIKNKLPQKVISQLSAKGFSSYGNQIGLATTLVREISHPGFKAKHMEVGMVVGASPAKNVIRKSPEINDLIILIGGKTGKDGIGGASGSSKSHDDKSLSNSSSEVQKGNPIEERKLQRLFRNYEFTKLIKKANDLGAGGIAVGVGELAESIEINLNVVPLKYKNLNPTEILLSESQERMAILIHKDNWNKINQLCELENTNSVILGKVTNNDKLLIKYDDKVIVNLDKNFLNSNGANRSANVIISKQHKYKNKVENGNLNTQFINTLSKLNVASQKGLQQQFDFTIGNTTVLSPYGGLYQLSPSQVSVQKIPVGNKNTNTSTMVSYGYNPDFYSTSPYLGAINAVIESIAKIVAAGGNLGSIKLSFQEYFEKLKNVPEKWGKPLAALLGTLRVMEVFKIAAIGGKDSMSGTFNNINVPPTLISFALSIVEANNVISTDFKKTDNFIYLFTHQTNENGVPNILEIKNNMEAIQRHISSKNIHSAFAIENGGIAAALSKMSFGNDLGFNIKTDINLFEEKYGAVILESSVKLNDGVLLGKTSTEWTVNNIKLDKKVILKSWEEKFNEIYPLENTKENNNFKEIKNTKAILNNVKKKIKIVKVLIPIFPGTNCEFDVQKKFSNAGGVCKEIIFNNSNGIKIKESINKFINELKETNILALVGGFSAGDEPSGSGKYIVNILKNSKVKKQIDIFLKNGGLILGVCNGFQALIKSGLLPYGKIQDITEDDPTLFKNDINLHIAKYVKTQVLSINSPWLNNFKINQTHTIPISHGEGKFIVNKEDYKVLLKNNQIAFQYIDNPNGSHFAVEGIISKDGNILGKMAHSERYEDNICKNIYGNKDQNIFKNAINYLKGDI